MPDDDLTRLPDERPKESLLSAGQKFGQYQLIRLLGRGGMGEVYEAEHIDLGSIHALKFINSEIVDRSDARERFKREARVMSRLRHPNIVHVDDFGEIDGRVWLRMDFIEGWQYEGENFHSLDELMHSQGALPEPLVKRFLAQVLNGLASAHDSGAVHRDIKPANCLLDAQGNIKITDFGLVSLAGADWLQSQVQLTVARSLAASTGSGQADPDATQLESDSNSKGTSTQALLGTYAYMSPEQKGGSAVDHRSDLYALGLIGFQMITGEKNVAFETPTDLIEGLDPVWDDWVKKALATRPERRFESAEAMRAMLVGADRDEVPLPIVQKAPTAAETPDRKPPSGSIPSINTPANFKLELSENEDLEMVWIAAGKFIMGSPNETKEGGFMGVGRRIVQEGEVGRSENEIQHEVTLSQGYWLGATAVTQGQWESVMASNPSKFKGSNLPVEQVSWEDAMSFCKKLTARERAAGRLAAGYEYTLPTEAQWEYACRAGTTGAYAGDLGSMAWYDDNSDSKTHPVGMKRANDWGLYDMHGNVWEWCSDWYGNYPSGSVVDPSGANSGSYRVRRGGGWFSYASSCRSAFRYRSAPGGRNGVLGFRLALRFNQ